MMNTRLALTLLFLAALLPVTAHAAKKKNAPEASAAGSSGLPSSKLEPFLEPCLDAILAPLEANPRLPRVEVEKLRATFAGGLIKAKTPAQKQIYQNAMGVCDSLNKAMDDRANARSAAQASSTVPMRSNATGIIKGSPTRGFDAGANAEAIRKKQKDERRDADTVARRDQAYMNSAAYRSWTDKAPRLRQGVMALYTRQIQLEALDETSTASVAAAQAAKPAPQPAVALTPVAPPAPPVEKPAPTAAKTAVAPAPAGAIPYLGKWQAKANGGIYTVNPDHTFIGHGGKTGDQNGKWELLENGVFKVQWGSGKAGNIQSFRISEDGTYLHGTSTSARWDRVNPTDAAADKPAEKGIPAEGASYAGTWSASGGKMTVLLKADHSGVRIKGGENVNGKWTVEADGDFHIKWEDHFHFKGKLSEDGQTIHSSLGNNLSWIRKP